ncbi:MAG: hypothetical protein J0L97_06630 [Alphaproteobacteria bacterium]|nr:hypothetical protein [Alphaproteobacteria bacterium]
MPGFVAAGSCFRIALTLAGCVFLSACANMEYRLGSFKLQEWEEDTNSLRYSGNLIPSPTERSLGQIRFTKGTAEDKDDMVFEIRKDQSRYMAETLVHRGKETTTNVGFSYDKSNRSLGLRLRLAF